MRLRVAPTPADPGLPSLVLPLRHVDERPLLVAMVALAELPPSKACGRKVAFAVRTGMRRKCRSAVSTALHARARDVATSRFANLQQKSSRYVYERSHRRARRLAVTAAASTARARVHNRCSALSRRLDALAHECDELRRSRSPAYSIAVTARFACRKLVQRATWLGGHCCDAPVLSTRRQVATALIVDTRARLHICFAGRSRPRPSGR